jgi:hypothetical protein
MTEPVKQLAEETLNAVVAEEPQLENPQVEDTLMAEPTGKL